MEKIEISIQLNPGEDGASFIPDRVRRKDKGALIIGTNGEFRVAEEEEAYELLDRLAVNCASDYVGKTEYLVIFNAKKVLCVSGTKFVVGSVMIVKGTDRGLEFLDEGEVEDAKAEFVSRLAVLCGSGIQFSAYEIG